MSSKTPTHFYKAIHVKRNIYRYEPIPVDQFWDEVKEGTTLVTLEKSDKQYCEVMSLLTGITPEYLTVREHYMMDINEWNQRKDRYFTYNPVVGAVLK